MGERANIVQAHLGKAVPEHLYRQLEQTRVFNPGEPIFLILSDGAEYDKKIIGGLDVVVVRMGGIAKCANHRRFLRRNRLNKRSLGGFWVFTSERFFAIESFLRACPLENVVHMENDVMLYAELASLLPALKSRCPRVGITMDSERRCIPGFVFLRDPEALSRMNGFIVGDSLRKRHNDMEALASFIRREGAACSALPVIPPRYRELYPLENAGGERGSSPWYDESFEAFGGVFDAAALGQFLGGIDKCEGRDTTGFVNETTVYDARKMGLSWRIEKGLRRPYGKVGDCEFPVFNLHIHSKRMEGFSSCRS